MNSNLDSKINSLAPGQIVEISRVSKTSFCEVSLSGDGKTLMFVRHTGDVSVVFKRCAK